MLSEMDCVSVSGFLVIELIIAEFLKDEPSWMFLRKIEMKKDCVIQNSGN